MLIITYSVRYYSRCKKELSIILAFTNVINIICYQLAKKKKLLN